jgi:CRP/FNR family transcriptional regulator
VEQSEGFALLESLRSAGVSGVEQRREAGDIIYRQGEDTRALYFLLEGLVKVSCRRPGGEDLTLDLLGPGEVFGGFGAIGGGQRDSAQALTACRALKTPAPFLSRSVAESFEAALGVVTLMERRLVAQEQMAGRLHRRKTEARLAILLPALARKFGEDVAGEHRRIGLRLTHTELAAMVASTRESVSQALGDMRRKGYIAVERGRIVILSDEGLERLGRS